MRPGSSDSNEALFRKADCFSRQVAPFTRPGFAQYLLGTCAPRKIMRTRRCSRAPPRKRRPGSGVRPEERGRHTLVACLLLAAGLALAQRRIHVHGQTKEPAQGQNSRRCAAEAGVSARARSLLFCHGGEGGRTRASRARQEVCQYAHIEKKLCGMVSTCRCAWFAIGS